MTRGVKFHAEQFFTVKSLIDFQTLNRHKINTTTASNMKTLRKTKVFVLIPNFASKLSHDRILNNSQSEVDMEVVYMEDIGMGKISFVGERLKYFS